MKKCYRFARASGTVACVLSSRRTIVVPVVPGLLKHPNEETLRKLLKKPDVMRKYTVEALRKGPWQILREFPPEWLKECLDDAGLSPRRRAAVVFMLSGR